MHRHPASKFLHDALYITINRKNEQVKTHNWLKYVFFFFTVYKNEWKEYKFWRQKNRKSDFYKDKKTNNIEDIDVNNILVSKKGSYGTKNSFKYFISYNDNDIIRPLCIRLPQMTGYARKFVENTTLSFIVKNKYLLKNFIKIWETIEKLMKINSESKPVYGNHDK